MWTKADISKIFHTPLLDLVFQAGSVHRQHHKAQEIQLCTLLSIKTGGCAENCAYCPQSAHYKTGIKAEKLMDIEPVLAAAKKAKEEGSSRFCMGAAWREVRDSNNFDQVLEMIQGVNALGLEVCCTLGMLTDEQAQRLKNAGLYAYNHNIDTSREHYPKIITTRTFDERLDTLEKVRNAGISVCCGGIVGLGETEEDRIDFLYTLATLPEPPESVPINSLIAIKGTPLQHQKKIPFFDILRVIATARIVMPTSMVRLSAGRSDMNDAEQALCFLAGANSIHTGEKLLTTPTHGLSADQNLLKTFGLTPKPSSQEILCTK